MKKVILIITIMVLILTSYIIPSIASPTTPEVKEEIKLADNTNNNGTSIKSLLEAGKNFIVEGQDSQENGDGESTTINPEILGNSVGFIYKIVLSLGSLLAVIVGIVIGIEFMMASSADEKAKWKETLKVYVVGVIIIYGALGIWFMSLNILNSYTPDSTKTQDEKKLEETLNETEKSQMERKEKEEEEKRKAEEEKKQQEELDEKRDERFNTWMRKH